MPSWDHRTDDLWIHVVMSSYSKDFEVSGFLIFYRSHEDGTRSVLLEIPISGSIPGQGLGGTVRRVLSPRGTPRSSSPRSSTENDITERSPLHGECGRQAHWEPQGQP